MTRTSCSLQADPGAERRLCSCENVLPNIQGVFNLFRSTLIVGS
eukprot:CAMPEP_0179880868 /NCGR_PEP_ID=MMETSP0982-20121206/27067_1 /TAXON_ID=483367 /ORGANISM="non described non described, Strain CCMP 2436" /LENGTH=43 /DNA_ID= /DNA_START= /DNA_END= /DNA_ORIENTATION=